MQKVILTGDRPTGKLHLGHYVGSLTSRLQYQDLHTQYVMIADVQALTDNFEDPKKITDQVYEVAMDYLAVGIDPTKTTIFVQSQVPALTELTVYFLNLVTVARLSRNPTLKTEIQQKGYEESLPAGFLCYPISQAADITGFGAELVPVGEDQLPIIEQTNEIVRRFNRIYQTDCLKEATAVLSHTPRLVGIDGKAKASKSLGNTIFLADSPEEIKQKVYAMYTDPGHIRVQDPGQVEGNVVFAYLDAFHHDKAEVESLKAQYAKGGLGDTKIKAILNDTLQTLLAPIRERRAALKKQDIQALLWEGTQKARIKVESRMQLVRAAIGFDYFK